MKSKSFFKKRKVTGFFAVIALIGGFLFLNRGITGNIILNSSHYFNLLSLIGLILVFSSIILIAYSLKKK